MTLTGVLRLVLGVRDDVDLLGERADLGVRAADGDVDLVLVLARPADLRRAVGVFDLRRRSTLTQSPGDLDLRDLERLVFLGVERDALRLGVALQQVEADEAGRDTPRRTASRSRGS